MTRIDMARQCGHNMEVEFSDNKDAFNIGYKAFLAGLKAGKLEWHDLRKDPNDLPDNLGNVWTNVGAGYHNHDGWWDDFGRLQGVVAWCQPKFEELMNDKEAKSIL